MTNDGYTYRALSRQKAVQYERKEKDDGTIGEGDGSMWLVGRAGCQKSETRAPKLDAQN